MRPHDGADARKDTRIAEPLQGRERRLLIEPEIPAEPGKGPLDQREVPLPTIDQSNVGHARHHCPILVARALKKIPDGFAASISAFLAKLPVSYTCTRSASRTDTHAS